MEGSANLFIHVLTMYVYMYVTRLAKIDHVGTFIYLRNTNLKYSMPRSSSVPDSNHVRFAQEA